MTTQEITTTEKINKLPWSIATNAANTVFVQFTYFGSAFVLFLNDLNFSKSQVGFLLSLLQFSSLVSLLAAPMVARIGYKRAYRRAFGTRTLVTAGLLLTPAIIRLGPQAAFIFITAIVGLFAIFRSIGVTAFFPWAKEYVPDSIRGRFSAANNLVTSLTGFIAVFIAGTLLDATSGLNGYLLLFAAAVIFGVLALWTASHRPGGAPAVRDKRSRPVSQDIKEALRDSDFTRYLLGVGFMTLAIVPLTSFVPLYMQEQIGIQTGDVVLIQTGILLGALISTSFWGWAADRYGSRPIMLTGTVIWGLLPVLWMLTPRQAPVSLYIALAIAFAQGIANMGWIIGGQRLLFNSIVPTAKRTAYLAWYSTWIGVAGGISLLAGGFIVQLSAGVSGQFLIFSLDPYTSLFIFGFILIVASILLLRIVRSDSQVGVDEFAGLFLRGNPFLAVTSLIRYQLASDEQATIESTTRLGETRSPLVVEELLELLIDPRFGVRMEAVISISHTRQDPRLTQAMASLLPGTEIALSVVAAWALGRMGDEAAIEPLRASLDSPFLSLQAHAVRALGSLGDRESSAMFLERLQSETDKGLQMAYASALGKLGETAAVPQLLETLEATRNKGARLELALSLARLVGDENDFVQLLSQSRAETGLGTALAQNTNSIRKEVEKWIETGELLDMLVAAGDALAHEDLEQAVEHLGRLLEALPEEHVNPVIVPILQACKRNFETEGATRIEYILLTIFSLEAGWESPRAVEIGPTGE